MKIFINNEQLNVLKESFRFDWENKRYIWTNDKKKLNMDTTITGRDEKNQPIYKYNLSILPKSGVKVFNLFYINNFYITQALKHNKILKYLSPKEKEELKTNKMEYKFTPDESISLFKKYVADYIIKILFKEKKYIDVIFSPESKSVFNEDIMKLVAEKYKKEFNRDVVVKSNMFIKTPENIKIDRESLYKNLKNQEENKYFQKDQVEKMVREQMIDIYSKVELWKIESDIYPIIKQLYRLYEEIAKKSSENKKYKTLESKVFELYRRLKHKVGDDYKYTRYFKYGKLKPEDEVKKWEIKTLSDSVRRSISDIMSFSKELDKDFSYKTKEGREISGHSSFIDNIVKKNKTILIFDDNMSSGTTLDESVLLLIKNGVKKENIIAVTLGVVTQSLYNMNNKIFDLVDLDKLREKKLEKIIPKIKSGVDLKKRKRYDNILSTIENEYPEYLKYFLNKTKNGDDPMKIYGEIIIKKNK